MTDPPPGATELGAVELVRWPTQHDVRRRLAASRRPRLLLVALDANPPDIGDDLEDWVRESAPEAEIRVRTVTLQRRAARTRHAPELDETGVLRLGSRWVPIPEPMIPVVETFLRQPNEIVQDRQLISAYADGGGSTNPRAVTGMLSRLDEKVRDVGLKLRRVRGRGTMLVVPT